MINKDNYKQILLICGLLLIIIIGIGITLYINNKSYEEYSFLDNDITKDKIDVKEYTYNIEDKKEETIIVHITGEVIKQGIVKIKEGGRVIDAIEEAGGTTEDADLSKINLAYILEDGSKIYIPSIHDTDEDIYENTGSIENTNNKTEPIRVNINTANETELIKIPGIGDAMAKSIITYRKENGKFDSTEELKNISGIGDSKYNNIKEYVYVK